MYIGIDWGGTKMEVIGLDAGGAELIRHRIPTPREDYDASIRAAASASACPAVPIRSPASSATPTPSG
jgi:fructokinase